MKVLPRLTALITMCLSVTLLSVNSYANVMAAQLRIANPDSSSFDGDFSDGSGALIFFYLNDTASAVTVDVVDVQTNTSVYQVNAGPMSRGLNSVAWDGSGSQAGGQYVIRVTSEQPNASTTDWTLFYDSGDINIFTRGVAVVTDQTDSNFGLIFTSNDGGPLGTGINIYNSDGSFHDPFLVAPDISSGGTINYGSDAPLFAVLDERGRIYVSLKDLGKIMRINRDYSTQVIIEGLVSPKGLYVEGDGQDFTIYVAADNQILRANVGTADTFAVSQMELVGDFSGFFPHQIIRDDDGMLYVTLRETNNLGSNGRGIRKFDISAALPVTDNDALWFLFENKTFIANDLLLDHGSDPNTSTDDILYYCTRAGDGNDQDGIWRIDDINSFFPDTVRIMTEDTFYGSDENVNARATLDFDAAGNIVFMENSNEHVFFLSPPGTGASNSFTTTAADTFTVNVPLAIGDSPDQVPNAYRLDANYPNPFNPSTTITYHLAKAGHTTLKIYNMVGQEVKTLVNENQAAGEFSVTWNGRDNSGQSVSSGIYILTLRSGKFHQSRRITLLK
ncbi:MAG: FlgD immunoglobulin-like domain containing protein [Calditrichia bacterium]